MANTMRAAVIKQHGGLEVVEYVEDLPIPEPAYGQVRLKMKAAALNRLDLFVREGWKGLELHFPHIIGSDGAGVVDVLGEGVTQFSEGDAVAIDPSVLPPDSPELMTGMENQSRNLAIMGEHTQGLAAEYVVVPARNLLKMPNGFDFKAAAAAGLVYVTAWHSLMRRGGLRAGESVLIVGAGGGVNSASIQIAKLAGAKVYVVGSNAEKCQMALDLGADVVINREEEPQWSRSIYKLTNKQGVDIVVDNVGKATLNDSIRSVRIGGRILIVGGTTGYDVQINVAQLFARQIALIGSTMGPHQDYVEVMNLLFAGKLNAVVGKVFSLKEAQQAQETLQNFDVIGKVVFDIEAS
jgi:NADPH:quinone reductase-like Zn-dependent oxidoreductase